MFEVQLAEFPTGHDDLILRTENGPAAFPVLAAHPITPAVVDAKDVAPVFQAQWHRYHLTILIVLVRAAFVNHLAQSTQVPRRFRTVIIQHQLEAKIKRVTGKRREGRFSSIVEGVFIGTTVHGYHVHLHRRIAVGRAETRKRYRGGFVLIQRPVPGRRLLGAAIDGVTDDCGRQFIRALVGQIDFDDHLATATQHPIRSVADANAHVHCE